MVTKVSREAKSQASADYNDYVRSGIWACAESPTKAHYWRGRNGGMDCIHCGEHQENPCGDITDIIITRNQETEEYNRLLREEGIDI